MDDFEKTVKRQRLITRTLNVGMGVVLALYGASYLKYCHDAGECKARGGVPVGESLFRSECAEPRK